MANREKIALLSKYQMRVLYYKCKEGATHEEIAEILGRDVNTVQYHMTKIYKLLEISAPGKSKEEMDSELKNEICPLIRQMFSSIDDVKVWAPSIKRTPDEEDENIEEEAQEPAASEGSKPPYQPPPSLEKVLKQATPEIREPPPPARANVNWRRLVPWVFILVLVYAGWRIYPHFSAFIQKPTEPPARPAPTQPVPSQEPPLPQPSPLPAEIPTSAPAETAAFTPTPTEAPIPTPSPIAILTQVSPKDGMALVYVPAGEFKMGSSRADDPETREEEIPQHTVDLDAYWIDQTEVTNAQYARCVADAGACTKPSDNSSLTHSSYYDNAQYAGYPVIFVSWSQAAAYCAWAGRRLPTEAEWEKAARGPDGRIYPWGNAFDGTLANYCDINCGNPWKGPFDDGYIETAPVGEYPAGQSVYGAFDMAGNIYEWVADWYAPYTRTSQRNPTGPASGLEHIIRGGSWGDDFAHVRAAVRSHINNLDYATNFIGFRCALPDQP